MSTSFCSIWSLWLLWWWWWFSNFTGAISERSAQIHGSFYSLPSWIPLLYDDNPDIFRTTPELIESRGFRSETHQITTDDGYVLQVFRIVNPYENRTLRPVLLWHGIGVSSDSWILSTNGRLNSNGTYAEQNPSIINDCRESITNALGFTLASCGHDVWLPNSRGGHYSHGHVRYNPAVDGQYWRFTLTEMAIYDVPAVIAYVLRITGQKSLAYVGHSLGTDQMFALQSLIPEYGQLVKPFVALAPVAFLGNVRSSLRLAQPLYPLARSLSISVGLPQFVSQLTAVLFCGNQFLRSICTEFLYSINGRDPANYNESVTPVLVAHSSVPTSSRLLGQLGQMIQTDRYQMLDYGPERNRQLYGQTSVPDYPLGDIRSPDIALFRGQNDALADPEDVERLVTNLNVTLLDNYLVPDQRWNHHDFQLAFTQGIYINQRLLRILERYQ